MTPLEHWRQLAVAENKRAHRNWQGLENETPVNIRDITLKVKPEETKSAKAVRMRLQRLHLDGLAPEAIAAQLEIAEAVVWKNLRGLYQIGWNNMSDAWPVMRVARVRALKEQGLEMREIANLLGVSTVLLHKDLRDMPQD